MQIICNEYAAEYVKYAECANKYATKYAQNTTQKIFKKYAEYAKKNMQNMSDP